MTEKTKDILKNIGYIFILLFFFGLFSNHSGTNPSYATPVGYTSSDSSEDFTYQNILTRLNEARLAHGREQLATDTYLTQQAQEMLVGNCPVTTDKLFEEKNDKNEFANYDKVGLLSNSGDGGTPLQFIDWALSTPTNADIAVGSSLNWKWVGIGVTTTPTHCAALIFGR